MTTPTCANCGSPWFEPRFGALFCCDCDTQFGAKASTEARTDEAAE